GHHAAPATPPGGDPDRSREMLLVAEELAQLGSWEWDVARDTVTWSDSLCRLFGVRPEDCPGTFEAMLEHVHPEDRERTREIVERAYQTGQPFDYHKRVVHPGGRVRLLHSRGRVVLGGDGRPVRMFGACQDVTERHRAEDELRASEA